MKGVVVKFDGSRGYGFIRVLSEPEMIRDIFVHISQVQGGCALEVGQQVIFDIGHSDKGAMAVNVVPGPKQKSPMAFFGIAASILVLCGMLGLIKIWPNMGWLGTYFASINFVTVVAYFYDKRAAGKPDYWRVPEFILHALCLLGGTPAALLSQYFFRHKTIKGSFRIVFWIILVVQLLLLAKFLLPS